MLRRRWNHFRDTVKTRGAFARAVSVTFASAMLVLAAKNVLGPFFADLSAAGFHDWDSALAYRYITVLAIRKYHELPWYNPYLCGGFPSWAYSEGAPNLVSPYLPFYLTLPILTAVRLEICGNAVVSAFGAYLLAARYTKSVALRAVVAVIYTFNGRWALQTAAGHSWHLQYAWAPLALFFFDVACERGRLRWALGAGFAIATMLYAGGIYPVPHTALLLLCFAAARAAFDRSMRPFGAYAIAGFSAIGLAGPKLLPVIDLMTRFERKIDSTEAIGLDALANLLVSRDQSFYGGGTFPHPYGWHEWGMYVGKAAAIAMLLALLFAHRARLMPAKLAGLVFVALSLGKYEDDAPWPLLHKFPIFASQHVPSRFLYLACLCLMLTFVGWLDRPLGWRIERVPWLDLLFILPAWLVAMDVAQVSRKTTELPFTLHLPKIAWHPTFRHVTSPVYNYDPPGAWAGPSLPAMMSNDGFLGCYSVPDRAEPHGAIAFDDSRYRGEARFDKGPGHAEVTRWSPNGAEVVYAGASPGALLVYNMNYDPSWNANGRPALEVDHAVAVRVSSASGIVRFRYFPRTLPWGIGLLAITVAAVVTDWRSRRRFSSTL